MGSSEVYRPPTGKDIKVAEGRVAELRSRHEQHRSQMEVVAGPKKAIYEPNGRIGMMLTIDGREEFYGMSLDDFAILVDDRIAFASDLASTWRGKLERIIDASPADTDEKRRVRADELNACTQGKAHAEAELAGWQALKNRIGASKKDGATIENREQLPSPVVIRIDKVRLEEIGKEEIGAFERRAGERLAEDPRLQGKLESLKKLFRTLWQLPEKIEFKPGMTLIVGDNGSGKSTIGRAIEFAMRIKDWMSREKSEWGSNGATYTRREAEDAVFNPSNRYDRILMKSARLAQQLARAIEVERLDVPNPMGGSNVLYTDFMGTKIATMDSAVANSEVNDNLDGLGPSGSSRQTIDEALADLRDWGENRPGQEFAAVWDEPEAGMSPRRHEHLLRELQEIVPEGSVAIVPTNSVKLYESDLPRIDLDHPERGVFRRSEYPDQE